MITLTWFGAQYIRNIARMLPSYSVYGELLTNIIFLKVLLLKCFFSLVYMRWDTKSYLVLTLHSMVILCDSKEIICYKYRYCEACFFSVLKKGHEEKRIELSHSVWLSFCGCWIYTWSQVCVLVFNISLFSIPCCKSQKVIRKSTPDNKLA